MKRGAVGGEAADDIGRPFANIRNVQFKGNKPKIKKSIRSDGLLERLRRQPTKSGASNTLDSNPKHLFLVRRSAALPPTSDPDSNKNDDFEGPHPKFLVCFRQSPSLVRKLKSYTNSRMTGNCHVRLGKRRGVSPTLLLYGHRFRT